MPRKKQDDSPSPPKFRPANMSPEKRENEIIALAYDLAEKQIREGTVSAQVLALFIKRGSIKDRLETENLEKQGKLLNAKAESLESAKESKKLYQDAMDAIRKYRGESEEESDDSDIQ